LGQWIIGGISLVNIKSKRKMRKLLIIDCIIIEFHNLMKTHYYRGNKSNKFKIQ